MDQRLHVITIGADDLRGMINFYTEILGWKMVSENTSVVCFQLNGFLFTIMQRQLLSNFMGIPFTKKETGFLTMGYHLNSKEEVICLYEDLKRKNVRILKEPAEPGDGACFFYFADIESNIFEVACNPYIILDEKGNAINYAD